MEQQGCLPQAPDMPRPLHASTPLSCPLCLGSVSNPEVLPGGRSLGPCPNCGHTMTFDPMVDPEVRVTLKINGEQHTVPNIYDATMSLNEYLREVAHLPGTKVMCREGGCGCCVVTATHFDPLQKRNKTIAVNSCLCLVYAIDGWEITTTEGIGSQRKGFHAIQARIADYSGSQCGFCTPGMVMNMYSLLSEAPRPSKRQVEDSLDGNICRCTGFRPILDAFKSFSPEADPIDLPGGPIDIEDLAKHGCSGSAEACEGQGQCRGEGHCQISRSPRSLSLTVTGGQWYRPTSLANLYTLLGQLQGRKYRLVYGNTSMGVYKNDGPFDVFINIKAVPELYRVKVAGEVTLGANLSLTSVIEVLDEVKEHQGFGYCGRLADHMRRVANVPVRNAGCWAGNMMMKHMHKDFPSDVFIVMETVGAMIQIGGEDDVCEVSPSDFLKLDMHQKVIETLLLPKLDDREYVRTYKVMPRSQNAHAYVNAGFRVQLDTTQKMTGRPTVVFGGISASFVHAKATEQYLLNRSLSDDHTLQEALKLLQDELIPDRNPVLASATYRRDLAVSLFYKFILDVSGEKVSSRLKSGATILKRPVSSGKQEYDTDKSKWPLTKPMPNVSSKLQASGEAQYVCDLPLLPGEFHAAFVLTTQGNATIATVDTSTALRSPGVVRYLGATDIPSSGANNFAAVGSQPEELFCSGKVLYAGQAVGIIIADTQLHADDAAIKVQISYKDVQPPILTIEEAIKKKSFFPPPGPVLKKGDAEKAIKSSDKTIAGTISMGTQYHFTMETQGCRVVPTEDGFDVQATTQWVDTVQSSIAQVLGIKNSHVCVQVKRLGGAYGAKISRNNQNATACALAASTLNRPVRMSLNLQTNMEMVGKRFPYLAEYEVGVSTQGKLNGIKITYYTDCGCSPNDNAVMGAILGRQRLLLP